jgi:glycosyltransferase involved in cell wall biosynthesis
VLHEIDVLAVPSSGAECSPRILIEAFSAGTPIVAYPSGGIPEIVRDRDSGLLTANNTPEALAAAIDQLMTDRGCMARFSANGRREWEARFRIDRFRNEVAELVERRGHVESRQPETATAVAGEDYLSRAGAPHR